MRHYPDYDQFVEVAKGKSLNRAADEFLRNIAGFAGMAAGCEYAVLLQAFQV